MEATQRAGTRLARLFYFLFFLTLSNVQERTFISIKYCYLLFSVVLFCNPGVIVRVRVVLKRAVVGD